MVEGRLEGYGLRISTSLDAARPSTSLGING